VRWKCPRLREHNERLEVMLPRGRCATCCRNVFIFLKFLFLLFLTLIVLPRRQGCLWFGSYVHARHVVLKLLQVLMDLLVKLNVPWLRFSCQFVAVFVWACQFKSSVPGGTECAWFYLSSIGCASAHVNTNSCFSIVARCSAGEASMMQLSLRQSNQYD